MRMNCTIAECTWLRNTIPILVYEYCADHCRLAENEAITKSGQQDCDKRLEVMAMDYGRYCIDVETNQVRR